MHVLGTLPPYRQGIIFLILNYNHIKATLRAADSAPAIGAAAAAKAKAKNEGRPSSPSAVAGVLGSAGASAIKECEVGG